MQVALIIIVATVSHYTRDHLRQAPAEPVEPGLPTRAHDAPSTGQAHSAQPTGPATPAPDSRIQVQGLGNDGAVYETIVDDVESRPHDAFESTYGSGLAGLPKLAGAHLLYAGADAGQPVRMRSVRRTNPVHGRPLPPAGGAQPVVYDVLARPEPLASPGAQDELPPALPAPPAPPALPALPMLHAAVLDFTAAGPVGRATSGDGDGDGDGVDAYRPYEVEVTLSGREGGPRGGAARTPRATAVVNAAFHRRSSSVERTASDV